MKGGGREPVDQKEFVIYQPFVCMDCNGPFIPDLNNQIRIPVVGDIKKLLLIFLGVVMLVSCVLKLFIF